MSRDQGGEHRSICRLAADHLLDVLSERGRDGDRNEPGGTGDADGHPISTRAQAVFGTHVVEERVQDTGGHLLSQRPERAIRPALYALGQPKRHRQRRDVGRANASGGGGEHDQRHGEQISDEGGRY